MDYDADEYYEHYLIAFLQEYELSSPTRELVRLLKDGTPRVSKKSVKEKYGRGKRVIVRETLNHPEILDRYRADKRNSIRPPMEHEDLADEENSPQPDWTVLLRSVRAVPRGPESAGDFHSAIADLLAALFYPSLVDPRREYPIHDGRKRIDITFTNAATTGFFGWLALNYAAGHVFIECKNYSGDPANPELDQLAGRFSPSRGQVGLLICRTFENKELFLTRCRDTANDHRGFILALDDDDLQALVAERQTVHSDLRQIRPRLLKDRFDRLVM